VRTPAKGVLVDLELVRRALAALDRLLDEHPELRSNRARDRLRQYIAGR
jgi:hypothetical protein